MVHQQASPSPIGPAQIRHPGTIGKEAKSDQPANAVGHRPVR